MRAKIANISLAARLLIASLFLLPLSLGLTGFYLKQAFETSLEIAENEQLKTQVYLLLAASDVVKDQVTVESNLTEPRFNQPESGLYGFIYRDKELIWASESARLANTGSPPFKNLKTGQSSFHKTLLGLDPYFAYRYKVIWENVNGNEIPLTFLTLHTTKPFDERLNAYNSSLYQGLGLVGILLLIAQLLVLRWGLLPLRKLAKELKLIESGEQDLLETSYPAEIQAVTKNLNHLVTNERNQAERYQTTLDDLAHSLKTPLAVLKGLKTGNNTDQDLAQEQLLRMDEIIGHQLKRASSRHKLFGIKPTLVSPIVDRLTNALSKVYVSKHIEVTTEIAEDLKAPIHESDLFEVLGSLIENAFKYGKQQVKIAAFITDKTLKIVIEDDGNGIEQCQLERIKLRGQRADEVQPGQGIGLAVALDIIEDYQGDVIFGRSELCGAKIQVDIPTTRSS